MTPVDAIYAQLPTAEDSADRVFLTDNAAIVLDGATALAPTQVSAQTYADQLGRTIADHLRANPDHDLQVILAEAIRETATTLQLTPDDSPSATVTIVRERAGGIDLLTLGDNTILIDADPPEQIIDDRLEQLEFPETARYKERLRAGTSYDAEHSRLLVELQQRQRAVRNSSSGYWIAERDPAAADHALIRRYGPPGPRWILAMTDGATAHLEEAQAEKTATSSSGRDLANMLQQWQRWEHQHDPNGHHQPRAKQTDDKTIVIIRRAPTTSPRTADEYALPRLRSTNPSHNSRT